MKKIGVLLVFGILLLASLSLVLAKQEQAGQIANKVITTSEGKEIGLQMGEKIGLIAGNVSAHTDLNITQEEEQNKTRLKVKLSNGRNAEIKIMPDTASERAIERLGQLNFTIQLKEVGKGNETRLAYELQAERHAKLLWLFRSKMQVKAEVDAENGEILQVKKPWWAFLASEPEE